MSTKLTWKINPKYQNSLPYPLRIHLEKRLSFPTLVSYELIPYLEGLESCDIEGARELIGLINLYEEIELNLQN